MPLHIVISILGLVLGVVGGIMLAMSMSALVDVLKMVTGAQEIFFRSMGDPRGIVAVVGLDEQLEKAQKKSGGLTITGIVLLIVSFVLQLVAVLMQSVIS